MGAVLSADDVAVRVAAAAGAARADAPSAAAVAAALVQLLPWARSFADAPISGFTVGAVALGASGRAYAGANLEFAGAPLGASVHAEQSAVANAWLHDERAITAIATTAVPCGHCRQFLMELGDPTTLSIVTPEAPPCTLADLLPSAFGPADLGVRGALLAVAADRADDDAGETGTTQGAADAADRRAAAMARRSYAPYTGASAGAALVTAAGTSALGRYAECAAYNPSLPALQCALASLRLAGDTAPIAEAVLAEAPGRTSQRSAAETLLAVVAPGIPLRYVRVEGNSAESSALS